MRTRAAVLYEMGKPSPHSDSKPLVIDDIELEGPGPGEVLVEIVAAGLCHSDLSVVNASPTAGHAHGVGARGQRDRQGGGPRRRRPRRAIPWSSPTCRSVGGACPARRAGPFSARTRRPTLRARC